MKWIFYLFLILSMAWAQRCPEPLYVVTTAELRWTAGNTTLSIAAGKTAAACEGDSIEAVREAQVSFGYATGKPQKRQLRAGERLRLELPRQAPAVVRGLSATLSDNVKNMAQRWLGGGSARPVEAASRNPEIAVRNIYMPLLALGHNRLVAGHTRLVLPYAEATAPYTLTLLRGEQVIAQSRSPSYHQSFVLELTQPLAAGQYRIRLESANGSLMQDELEVLPALPQLPGELEASENKTGLSVLWLSRQPSWALEAYQQAMLLQTNYPALGVLVSLMTPTTLEEEKNLVEALGQ